MYYPHPSKQQPAQKSQLDNTSNETDHTISAKAIDALYALVITPLSEVAGGQYVLWRKLLQSKYQQFIEDKHDAASGGETVQDDNNIPLNEAIGIVTSTDQQLQPTAPIASTSRSSEAMSKLTIQNGLQQAHPLIHSRSQP